MATRKKIPTDNSTLGYVRVTVTMPNELLAFLESKRTGERIRTRSAVLCEIIEAASIKEMKTEQVAACG